MRHEVMMEMSLEQLDQYARVCGIDTGGKATKEEKVALIEERRGRVAEIEALGTTLVVPVRALHDKRVTDALDGSKPLADDEAEGLLARLLGEEQYAEVVGRCTDEDGVVDVEALAFAFGLIVRSEELKNF